MLGTIRKHSAGILVKTLLGLLILSFAAWGVADVVSPGGGRSSVAQVGNIEIGPDQVRSEYQRELERLSGMFGNRLDSEQARSLGLAEIVVQRIIDRTLFDLAAREMGVTVGDDLVLQEIQGFAGFKNNKGEFERLRFEQALQQIRMTESMYVELTRGDISRAQFLSMIRASSAAPKIMTDIFYRQRNEKRTAETVAIPFVSSSEIADPSDGDLATFHKENEARFTAPEYRKLTYISMTAGELAKEIAIDEEIVKSLYESRVDEFTEEEKRTLLQIRFQDEETANKAHELLSQGQDFAQVAMNLAEQDDKAIQLGNMGRKQLLPALADAAFALKDGNITKPIKSVLGWHILKQVGVIAERRKSFDEMKESLRKELAAEESIDSLYNLANQLEDQLGGGATLEEAAQALDVPIKTIADIDRNGNDPQGTKLTGLPKGKFLETAYATPVGEESQLNEAGDDGYYIVRIDNIVTPAVKPLDSVRNDVIEAWKEGQQRAKTKDLADAMLERLKSGVSLAELASERGLDVKMTEPFTRRDGKSGLPADVALALFDAKIGEAVTGQGHVSFVVALLKDIIEANPASDPEGVKSIGSALSQAVGADMTSQLAAGLRRQFSVSVNTSALNELY